MIHLRKERPDNYHCTCKYCSKLFKGELIQEDGKYYSARKREGYSSIERTVKHLDKGHWQGYQFVIENYTEEGDIVFDPMVGSGTAAIEALKLKRKAIGIELEYFEILKANCAPYPEKDYLIKEGDCREELDCFDNEVDCIVTGTVYNNNSDVPERKIIKGKDGTFNYTNKQKNIAFLKDPEYYEEIMKLYGRCSEKLKKGGTFSIIIKDPTRKKAPHLLHYELASRMEELGLKVEAIYIHYHYPPTLFMSTYPKRFPEVNIPLYQTIVVMRKQ